MATSTALMLSQVTALQQANEAMHKRRTRKRKTIQSNCALSVAEVQAMVVQNHIEIEIREEKRRQGPKRGCRNVVGAANKTTPSAHVQIERRYLCIRCVNLNLFEVVLVEKMNCQC
jgi:hypothetical protein